MIVGDGMLARAFAPRFAERTDVLVFGSGVSNSLCTDAAAFAREARLLEQSIAAFDGTVIYFGTCSVEDADRQATPYARHKLALEQRVLAHSGGLVLRLPQVVGRTDNPHTLTNFLHARIMRGESFDVWQYAERNLIDASDIAAIGAVFVERSLRGALAIAAQRSITMPALVATFERVLGRDAHTVVVPRGAPLHIAAPDAHAAAESLGIDLGDTYPERLLRKYYAPV